MATFNAARLCDKKVVCPYDSAHVLTVVTISKHLIKCAKRNSDVTLERCPFNATHRVKSTEFSQHLVECQDRDVVDRQLVQSDRDDKIRGNLNVPAYDICPTVQVATENWDNDENAIILKDYVYETGDKEFLDAYGLKRTSKEERLKLYQKLFPEAEKVNEQLPTKSDIEPAAENVQKTPPKEIRRPNHESVAGMINKEYAGMEKRGLGRGLRRCAANFSYFADKDPLSSIHTDSSIPKLNGSETSQENLRRGMGRGGFLRHLKPKENINKTVTAPPGFEDCFTNQMDKNEDPAIQVLQKDNEGVKIPSQQSITDDHESMSQFNDFELQP